MLTSWGASRESGPAAASLVAVPIGDAPAPLAGGSGVRLAARPQPGGAILRFALQTGGPVKLEVFDVAGRRLTTLVDGVRAAGEHELAWDGATPSGRAASGVYFARIVAPTGTTRATVILAE